MFSPVMSLAPTIECYPNKMLPLKVSSPASTISRSSTLDEYYSLNARHARTSTPDQFRDMIKRNARNNSKLEFDNSENLSTISKLSEEQQKDNTDVGIVSKQKATLNVTDVKDDEKEINTVLIETMTKLKNLVVETRIIDDVDDEVWLMDFVEELQVHLSGLCKRGFKKRGRSAIKQKKILLQVCEDLITYLEKRRQYADENNNGESVEVNDAVTKNNNGDIRIKNLLQTLDQCLNNLKDQLINKTHESDLESINSFNRLSLANRLLQGQYKDEVINFRGNDVIATDGSLISSSCDSDFQLSMRDGKKLVTISVTDYDVAKSEVDESMKDYDESDRNYDVIQNCDAQSYLTWDDAQSTSLVDEVSFETMANQCDLLSPEMFRVCEDRIIKLKANLRRLRRNLIRAKIKGKDKNRQIIALQHRIKKMQLEIEKANNEKLCLEDEIFTLQENALNEKSEKDSQLEELKKKVEKLKNKRKNEKNKIKELKNEVADLNAKNEELHLENNVIKQEKEKAEKNLQEMLQSFEQNEKESLESNLVNKKTQTKKTKMKEFTSQTDVTECITYDEKIPSTSEFGCQVEDTSYTHMKAYDFYAKQASQRAKMLIVRGRNFQKETFERARKARESRLSRNIE